MAEIESHVSSITYVEENVTSSDSDDNSQSEETDSGEEHPNLPPDEQKQMGKQDIINAAHLGYKTRCEELVKRKGRHILHKFSAKGHSPVHKACQGRHLELLKFFTESGAPINACTRDGLGMKPIHWGIIYGSLPIVDFIVSKGVLIEEKCGKGYTPLMTAAQYGQTGICVYLVNKGAEIMATDPDGDSALHWAAYNGNMETAQYLMNIGINPHALDGCGQNCLHLSVLSKSMTTVELFLDKGLDPQVKDNNGNTPIMLAVKRKYNNIATALYGESAGPTLSIQSLIYGPNTRGRWQVIFFLCAMLLWGYPFYYYKLFVPTFEMWRHMHTWFIVSNVIMWIFYLVAAYTKPGYLPCNTEEYELVMKQLRTQPSTREQIEADDYHNPMLSLCHTCKLVRPPRARHCRLCKRCINHFDHHCPWVNNCVGYRNRVSFITFLLLLNINGWASGYMYLKIMALNGSDLSIFINGFLEAIFGLPMTFLLMYNLLLIGAGLTTHEHLHYKQYKFMMDSRGSLKNPFSRGFVKNLLVFLHVLPPVKQLQKSVVTA